MNRFARWVVKHRVVVVIICLALMIPSIFGMASTRVKYDLLYYLPEELDTINPADYDCLIVDEAQFLTRAQVERLVAIVDEMDVPVICYGLRADFQGNLFEGSRWLLAWADTIEEIKTVCWCGRKATCNARISNGHVVKAGEQIMLGGNESYVALCRKHWAQGKLRNEGRER